MKTELKFKDITGDIIGAAYEVYNTLGYGFLEKVYQRAMKVELTLRGRMAELEYPIDVDFKNEIVGNYSADLFVERCVIVELKVAPEYDKRDEAQIINQLKATKQEVGLLINFGKFGVEFDRFVN